MHSTSGVDLQLAYGWKVDEKMEMHVVATW